MEYPVINNPPMTNLHQKNKARAPILISESGLPIKTNKLKQNYNKIIANID